jgi:hypothetical protein
MRRLLPLASFLLFLTFALVWWLDSRQPKPVELIPTLTNQPEYCITCHIDLTENSASHPIETFRCRNDYLRRCFGFLELERN